MGKLSSYEKYMKRRQNLDVVEKEIKDENSMDMAERKENIDIAEKEIKEENSIDMIERKENIDIVEEEIKDENNTDMVQRLPRNQDPVVTKLFQRHLEYRLRALSNDVSILKEQAQETDNCLALARQRRSFQKYITCNRDSSKVKKVWAERGLPVDREILQSVEASSKDAFDMRGLRESLPSTSQSSDSEKKKQDNLLKSLQLINKISAEKNYREKYTSKSSSENAVPGSSRQIPRRSFKDFLKVVSRNRKDRRHFNKNWSPPGSSPDPDKICLICREKCGGRSTEAETSERRIVRDNTLARFLPKEDKSRKSKCLQSPAEIQAQKFSEAVRKAKIGSPRPIRKRDVKHSELPPPVDSDTDWKAQFIRFRAQELAKSRRRELERETSEEGRPFDYYLPSSAAGLKEALVSLGPIVRLRDGRHSKVPQLVQQVHSSIYVRRAESRMQVANSSRDGLEDVDMSETDEVQVDDPSSNHTVLDLSDGTNKPETKKTSDKAKKKSEILQRLRSMLDSAFQAKSNPDKPSSPY